MQKISLEALARQQMKLAATAGGRHTADTVYGGHDEKVLRQTVIGMIAGQPCRARESWRGDNTILHGRVRLSTADLSWEGVGGDLLIIPDRRHGLEALEDGPCS